MHAMKRTHLLFASIVASCIACGGAQSQPAQLDNATPAPPPKLPPSMGGAGAAAPSAGAPASDMPRTGHQDAPSGEMEKGLAALDRGDIPAAKQSLQEMIKKNPKDGEAYHFAGLIAEKE